jgi:hypothetical protein
MLIITPTIIFFKFENYLLKEIYFIIIKYFQKLLKNTKN